MNIRPKTLFLFIAAKMFLSFSVNIAFANEIIIQQEKMSFERCLNVITVSEKKLSIAPKILTVSTNVRAAIFYLIDGQLKILCDGEKNVIFVSSIEN